MHFSDQQISTLDKSFRRNLINSVTGFKSVALIGTKSQEGTTNVAPFSQIIHVGADPAMIGVLFRPHTVKRHTLENILTTKVYTINHITAEFLAEVHHTAARWQQSEFEACKLQEEYLEGFEAPFVRNAKIKIGLSLVERLDVQSNGTHLIIGVIKHLIAPEEVVGKDGFIDLEAAGTLTSSGLDSYHKTKRLARFTYAKPNVSLKKLLE
ncbi:flavin reductase family protein [Marinoscillum furvescens]|uniref:Flavin reductase (DIM6/NTAB) family NADH-FMN oxidoreductase RutF n=1 Tax=Marinoscillum furvescens DSM 4134 TaxID=1122208 RepID=A0A3D9L5I2_MARFU|nr:flavin reductase [Marinoscillum furvescens]REE01263.1 flavin reductase (DIM6/NTAB) family NADH-FMN oxidoreductase RutF [Marinoscillum furvescens DSM 4134]